MIIRFPWQKIVSEAEVLALALNILFEKAGTFSSEEEMKAFLKNENARPQYEHDAEMGQAMKEARRRLASIL